MRILIVGSGAREHALAWKCAQSPLAERVYVAPGNGGTPEVARNVAVSADDSQKLVKLARKEKIVYVGVNHRLNLFGLLHLADLGGEKWAEATFGRRS